MILDAIRKRWPWVEHPFADGAYDRTQFMDKAAFLDFVIEVVRRIDAEPGRRLVRDYQQRLDVSEAMIHVAMGSLLLRRITY
jgi:hypothetical protein